MKACVIEPLDIVSIRDGRSFDAGGASLARALWPPSPWTVLGAIRARLVMARGQDPREYGGFGWKSGANPPAHLEECIRLLGRPEDFPTFQIGPVLLERQDGTILFPAPLDILSIARNKPGEIPVRLSPKDASSLNGRARCSSPWPYLLLPPEEGHPGKKVPYRYLSMEQAKVWLRGETPQPNERFEEPILNESRIGIAIDPDTGRVREGMFYQRRGFVLQKGWRLLVPIIEDLKQAVGIQGVGELGGDRHAARFSWGEFMPPESCQTDAELAVLWFLSPVRAQDLTSQNLSNKAQSQVTVLCVGSGRPVSIGGWRMWRDSAGVSRPRSMRRYHPAGTCVYVRGQVKSLHFTSVARDPGERAAGFGVCMVGAWPRS